MSQYLLGHCPRLGAKLSVLVWQAVLDDPWSPDHPKRQRRRTFKECWDAVMECIVEGDDFTLDQILGVDLDDLQELTDHDDLREYLSMGLVAKLEMVEHGYFSAILTETSSQCQH